MDSLFESLLRITVESAKSGKDGWDITTIIVSIAAAGATAWAAYQTKKAADAAERAADAAMAQVSAAAAQARSASDQAVLLRQQNEDVERARAREEAKEAPWMDLVSFSPIEGGRTIGGTPIDHFEMMIRNSKGHKLKSLSYQIMLVTPKYGDYKDDLDSPQFLINQSDILPSEFGSTDTLKIRVDWNKSLSTPWPTDKAESSQQDFEFYKSRKAYSEYSFRLGIGIIAIDIYNRSSHQFILLSIDNEAQRQLQASELTFISNYPTLLDMASKEPSEKGVTATHYPHLSSLYEEALKKTGDYEALFDPGIHQERV